MAYHFIAPKCQKQSVKYVKRVKYVKYAKYVKYVEYVKNNQTQSKQPATSSCELNPSP